MKWEKKARVKNYDRRTRTKFLWFPKCIQLEYRWMSVETWSEVFKSNISDVGWVSVAWQDDDNNKE